MEFNGREVVAPSSVTVLRAAEINGIYIPTLCSHKDLSPFGGCRMCIVEIDGIRGYPLACNTNATDGMKVLTDTVAIQDIRREVLQLILSEHPSSCLVCAESDECKEFSSTVRKSGVTTGCRWCPNDGQCELQDLVEKLGITDIGYPILYRHYETERQDPFFDRDYNFFPKRYFIQIFCSPHPKSFSPAKKRAKRAVRFPVPQWGVDKACGKMRTSDKIMSFF